jgi:predicted DNA-binding protein
MLQGTSREVVKMAKTNSVITRIDKELADALKDASKKTGRSQIAISREISKMIKGKKNKIEWRFKV